MACLVDFEGGMQVGTSKLPSNNPCSKHNGPTFGVPYETAVSLSMTLASPLAVPDVRSPSQQKLLLHGSAIVTTYDKVLLPVKTLPCQLI